MKLTLTLLFLGIGLPVCAQVQIGSSEIATLNHAGKISKQQLEDFKKTTTLFTLQYKDYQQKEEYEKAIASVWKVTPFKIITPGELKEYIRKNYSVFTFGIMTLVAQGRITAPTYMRVTYDLWMPGTGKKGRIKQDFLARIWLYPNNKVLFKNIKSRPSSDKKYSEKMIPFLYNKAVFYNWTPGFLKGYLKVVNEHLQNGKERGPYSWGIDRSGLAQLKKDTLYVPDYAFIRFNPFTAAESKVKPDMDELHKAYPFPVRVVSASRLNQLILSGDPVKYLMYVKSSTDKFIDVYDGQTGDMLYAQYVKVVYNFKYKDLKRLAREIK